MGSSSPYAGALAVKLLLATFVLGLGLIGATTVRAYLYAARTGWAFSDAVKRFLAGEASWDAVAKVWDLEAARRLYVWNTRLDAGALIIFVLGAFSACAWLVAMSYERVDVT